MSEGENHTTGRVEVTVVNGEARPDASARLNTQTDLPADGGQDAGLLQRFSDLADRYWNGSKSLLRNQQFKR